ncbi:MAG: non-homologous end-joining DNA ligase [Microbacterium sp.]|nr:non-homologous end-joining DNA ligase [Microbacterium sp.]
MVADAQVVQVDGRRLRVTNLDKVVYPETGTTKGEVIAYYTRIAPLLLPLLEGRPVTRKRWVEGVGTAAAPADAFFTKQLERGAPSWIPRQEIVHSDGPKEYPLVEDVPTLVWLAQVAAIELHVPQWRFGADGLPGRPDRLVLDLDPGPGVELAQCAEVARMARSILTDMGLDPVPVTSGSKGIHLYAALPGAQTSEEVSLVVKELARLIEGEHPELATSVMSKAVRGGRVFLDWSQNNAKKTTISPYSLRGRAQPWVAAPRTWDELDDPGLAQLDLDAVLQRAEDGVAPLTGLLAPREQPPAPAAPSRHRRPALPRAAAVDAAPISVAPMLAENGTPALARGLGDPAWVEVKWDGIRAIGTWSGGRMLLHARSGTDITARYPELTADGAPALPVADAVVDGEIVAFDAQGRPSFSLLQNRMHLTRPREIEREVVRTPIVYLVFDLLRLDGHDLTDMPLSQRRTLLEDVVSDLDAPMRVPPVFDDVDAALAASREFGLEGVVVKDSGSRYRPGQRSPSWMKVKHTRMQEAVIVGIRPGKGDREGTIGSLLLAVPDGRALRYVGRVGTGFTDRMLRDLLAQLKPLRIDTAPLHGVPALDASDALWVRPELVGEVEFANWTPDGILRHSRWRGLRPDKTPSEVSVER